MVKEKIEISKELFDNLKKRYKDSGFDSVDDYIDYILKQVVSDSLDEGSNSSDDEELVRKNLKEMGYL
jgi:hypothetical protein